MYLIDEIEKMIDMMEGEEVLAKSLEILYPTNKINNPIEMILLFVRGLKENEFFDYVLFVDGIRNGGRTSKI